MNRGWQDFLGEPSRAAHGVQVYRECEELAHSVVEYLVSGFESGEPAIVIATPEHWATFAEGLASRRWDAARIERDGFLVVADAEATLASFMVRGRPSPDKFERVVGRLIDRVSAHKGGARVRAFGEMVDILNQRGELEAAIALEELWNSLLESRDFSLLCGYRVDIFDRDAEVSALPEICRVHSHVLPAADPERLHAAVDAALEDVLGPAQAGMVYALSVPQMGRPHVPVAQLALMMVSEQAPVLAERVLTLAREKYVGDSAAATA